MQRRRAAMRRSTPIPALIPACARELLGVGPEHHGGELAEWLRTGLQIREDRFDSGTRLQIIRPPLSPVTDLAAYAIHAVPKRITHTGGHAVCVHRLIRLSTMGETFGGKRP